MGLSSIVTSLLPGSESVALESITRDATGIQFTLSTTQPTAACPVCQTTATRVHSRYTRTLADLPWADVPVTITLAVRRFRCLQDACPRRLFTERLPTLVAPYARRTQRLISFYTDLVLTCGATPGVTLGTTHGWSVSDETLLRLLCTLPVPATGSVRAVGIDEWAWKKRHTYGTLIVDLDTHRPLDLLPDRSADSVAAWLRQHPTIEIVSRDRGQVYADGATRGAPQAVQVADRFHLLQNLRDAVRRLCDRQQTALQAASLPPPSTDPAAVSPNQAVVDVDGRRDPISADPDATPETTGAGNPMIAALGDPDARPNTDTPAADSRESPTRLSTPVQTTRSDAVRQARRDRRHARYDEVRALSAQGMGKRAIARHLSISRATVTRFLTADVFPERATRSVQMSKLDRYKPYLDERVVAGIHNARQLWEEIGDHGYCGSASLVRQYVGTLRVGRRGRGSRDPVSPTSQDAADGAPPRALLTPPAPQPRRLSARQAAWLLVRPAADRTATQQEQVDRLLEASADLAVAQTLAQEFGSMIREQRRGALDSWLEAACASTLNDLISFAHGIQQTYAEVAAALELPWSNGPVEGHVNRLKTLKRGMYGRATFAVLRARVLHRPERTGHHQKCA